MVFNINNPPSETLESDESAVLDKFKEKILDNWVKHSCSTADLSWRVEVADEEPKRFAVLFTKQPEHILHRESFYSLRRKLPESFEEEFIKSALAYPLRSVN